MANLGREKLQIRMEEMITFHFNAWTICSGSRSAVCLPRPW